MNEEQWIAHISRRSDFASRITHLTRRTDDKSAFEVLCKILDEKTIIGSGAEGYIRNNCKAVCFQDVPLYAMAENIRYEEGDVKSPFYHKPYSSKRYARKSDILSGFGAFTVMAMTTVSE